MRIPRFLITQNRSARNTVPYVIHSRNPACTARVVLLNEEPTSRSRKLRIQIGELPAFVELVEVYQDAPQEEVREILKQMAKWLYHPYLKSRK
ncbi:hypothetical protein [Telluribacter humicola]|uniref:hypothetical protein n=1 Tax=Telluribacter humicola TaxID=1720261 RepID=UPI001A969776|nr:hypothetical protein [Telluribacter humicola]